MRNVNSLKYRSGCYSEGSKGPFQGDVMGRMAVQLNHLAKRSPMSLDELRVDLNKYFSEYFGKGCLSRTPSDAGRRVRLVDKMVVAIDDIRSGRKVTPLWN